MAQLNRGFVAKLAARLAPHPRSFLVSITADASFRGRRRHRNTHPNGGIGASTTEVHVDGS